MPERTWEIRTTTDGTAYIDLHNGPETITLEYRVTNVIGPEGGLFPYNLSDAEALSDLID